MSVATVVVTDTPDGPVETALDRLPRDDLAALAALGNDEAAEALLRREKPKAG